MEYISIQPTISKTVVAVFMYQNKCAINIFFYLRQGRPTTNFLKFKTNKNRYSKCGKNVYEYIIIIRHAEEAH